MAAPRKSCRERAKQLAQFRLGSTVKASFLPFLRAHHTKTGVLIWSPERRPSTQQAIQCVGGIILGLLLIMLAGCATGPASLRDAPAYAFAVVDDGSPAARHAPVFVPESYAERHNRIGTARARRTNEGETEVYVDPSEPTVYVQQQRFTTDRGEFTNYIYRVHLPEVPVRWIPFHLTAGPNGGLIIVVTVDATDRPLLLTTVHTCGCYLALVPTQFYPDDALPEDWPKVGDSQHVYGERLPAHVAYSPAPPSSSRVALWLREGTHRIMHLERIDGPALGRAYRVVPMTMRSAEDLLALPLPEDGATSFFYESGRKKGYVKNTVKPFERLLMSWWALDWNVGVDKRLGPATETGTVFYTSLKPWARAASDLWNFPAFLTFWGFAL